MNVKIFSWATITILIDQLSKIIISTTLVLNKDLWLIPQIFSFKYIENSGAAWSLFNNKISFLVICSLIALVIIFSYAYKFSKNWRNNISFGLLIGGILGNLIDRLFLGYVRDFISIKIFSFQYPIFNIADSAIVIGVILLIIAIIKGEDKVGN